MLRRTRSLGMLGGVIMIGAMAAWAQQPGPAERAGEKLDQAGRKARDVAGKAAEGLKEGAQDLAGELRQGFARARRAVDAMGIEARIYGRLHWDKALQNADLQVDLRPGGVAVLRGTVPDATARTKAVALARETVGVNEVADELSVAGEPPRSTTTTKSTTGRPGPNP